MKNQQKPKPEIYDVYDDEIDLFELFRKIWKWKWLTFGLIIIICISTFFYLKVKPATYTIELNIRIGKIANVLLEETPEVMAFIQSKISQINFKCLSLIDTSIKKTSENIINIKCTGNSSDACFQFLDNIINNFLKYHNSVYKKALKRINDNITSMKTKIIISPVYILDTYTFPTSLTTKLEKPSSPDSKKIPVKMAVAFFASLFLGIFLSFLVDYILTNMKKKK